MRCLEIIPGKQTSAETIRITRRPGEACRKELSTLNAGICGFVSNRMMYAMMRKAFHLVESGVADLETVDRSFRNDIGWNVGGLYEITLMLVERPGIGILYLDADHAQFALGRSDKSFS